MIPDLANSLDLFFGDANPAVTRVYARLRRQPDSLKAGLQQRLAGTLTGPYCKFAQTLPATIPFSDTGPGESLLAQAVVPDPCFWTPELPFLYQARIELQQGREVVQLVERTFGIRPLGARGKRFYYEGKPWVLRGVQQEGAELSELPEFREAAAAMLVDDPSEELCAAASEQGVLIVANLIGAPAHALEDIPRLARHAAVGFIVLDESYPDDADVRSLAPNVVLVQRAVGQQPRQRQWAQAWLSHVEAVEYLMQSRLPVIAYRRDETSKAIGRRRALCDLLQRDLAGDSEIAGYVV